MNYEERYKQVLERAKKELSVCGSQDCDAARQIFRLFPELNESEDEWIKEDIKDVIQAAIIPKESKREMLAWLEKQGEQKPIKASYTTIAETGGGGINALVTGELPTDGCDDGKIRKAISCCIDHGSKYKYLGVTMEEMCAWLEKQGKKDPCIGCTNDKGCVTCENGNLKETKAQPKFMVY